MSEPRVTRVQRRMVHKIVEALNDDPVVLVAYAQLMWDMVQFRIVAVDGRDRYRPVPGKSIERECIDIGAGEFANVLLFGMNEERKKEPPRWSVVFDRLGELPGVDEVHGHLSEGWLGVCLSTNYGAKVSWKCSPNLTAVDVYRRIVEALHNEIPALTVMGSSVH